MFTSAGSLTSAFVAKLFSHVLGKLASPVLELCPSTSESQKISCSGILSVSDVHFAKLARFLPLFSQH